MRHAYPQIKKIVDRSIDEIKTGNTNDKNLVTI